MIWFNNNRISVYLQPREYLKLFGNIKIQCPPIIDTDLEKCAAAGWVMTCNHSMPICVSCKSLKIRLCDVKDSNIGITLHFKNVRDLNTENDFISLLKSTAFSINQKSISNIKINCTKEIDELEYLRKINSSRLEILEQVVESIDVSNVIDIDEYFNDRSVMIDRRLKKSIIG